MIPKVDRPAGRAVTDSEIHDYVAKEANSVLQRGAIVPGLPGYSASPVILIVMATGVMTGLLLPAVFSFIGGVICTLIYILARQNRIKELLLYVIFTVLTGLPTAMFITTHFTEAGGRQSI